MHALIYSFFENRSLSRHVHKERANEERFKGKYSLGKCNIPIEMVGENISKTRNSTLGLTHKPKFIYLENSIQPTYLLCSVNGYIRN